MEMKEILALICTIGVVFLLIFIASLVRGKESGDPEMPELEPTGLEYEKPAETDIWDVLHEMQATTEPPAETEAPAKPEYQIVTETNAFGESVVVTDEEGNPVTVEVKPEADPDQPADEVPDGQGDTTETEAVPAEPSVLDITINPDELESQEKPDNPMFIVADPADE